MDVQFLHEGQGAVDRVQQLGVVQTVALTAINDDLGEGGATEMRVDGLGGLAHLEAFREPVQRVVAGPDLRDQHQRHGDEDEPDADHGRGVAGRHVRTPTEEALERPGAVIAQSLLPERRNGDQCRQQRQREQQGTEDADRRHDADVPHRLEVRRNEGDQPAGGGEAGHQHGKAGMPKRVLQGLALVVATVDGLKVDGEDVHGIAHADGEQQRRQNLHGRGDDHAKEAHQHEGEIQRQRRDRDWQHHHHPTPEHGEQQHRNQHDAHARKQEHVPPEDEGELVHDEGRAGDADLEVVPLEICFGRADLIDHRVDFLVGDEAVVIIGRLRSRRCCVAAHRVIAKAGSKIEIRRVDGGHLARIAGRIRIRRDDERRFAQVRTDEMVLVERIGGDTAAQGREFRRALRPVLQQFLDDQLIAAPFHPARVDQAFDLVDLRHGLESLVPRLQLAQKGIVDDVGVAFHQDDQPLVLAERLLKGLVGHPRRIGLTQIALVGGIHLHGGQPGREIDQRHQQRGDDPPGMVMTEGAPACEATLNTVPRPVKAAR